jgi:sterol 14-demethylase
MVSFNPQVYGYSVPTFGNGVVYDVDQKIRTEQFRWFTEALKKDRLKKYVPMFLMEAEVGAIEVAHLVVGCLL